MTPEGTPSLDAHNLRLQIDAALLAVENLVQTDPNQEISGRTLGMLLTILGVVRQQYGSDLILDNEIAELLITQAPEELPGTRPRPHPEPITAIQMQLALASARASLLAREDLEARTTPYGSAEASLYRSPDTERRDLPPGSPSNWREGPGDRQYRIATGRQQRRTAVHGSRGIPW